MKVNHNVKSRQLWTPSEWERSMSICRATVIAVARLSLFSSDWGKFSLSSKNTRTFFQAWPTFPSEQPHDGHRWLPPLSHLQHACPATPLPNSSAHDPPIWQISPSWIFIVITKAMQSQTLKKQPLTWMKTQPCKISKDKFPMGFPNRFQCLLTWLATFSLLSIPFEGCAFEFQCVKRTVKP